MIFTEIFGNLSELTNPEQYHVETAMVKSDDLAKSILRVTSDHQHDFGIRLEDDDAKLENGTIFKIDDHHLLALSVIPDEMITITPKNIDEMGIIAHTLGNLHKPVRVKDGKISLLYDKIIIQNLDKLGADYIIEDVQLEESLRYVDLS